MSIQCNFCYSYLKDEKILKKHQNTARSCLEKQKKLLNITCICSKVFICQEDLEEHKINCNQELKKQISDLQKLNLELQIQIECYKTELTKCQKSLEDIAKVPKTQIYNKITNNLSIFNLDKNQIKEIINTEFTEKEFRQGITGCANFAYTSLILDENQIPRMICTNFKNMHFKYLNDKNELVSDIGAVDLCDKLFEGNLHEKSTQICETLLTTYPDREEKWRRLNLEIVSIRNEPIKLAKLLRILIKNESETLKNESREKQERRRLIELEKMEEIEMFQLECDEEYDVDSDIVLSDTDNEDVEIEKSEMRKRIRMSIRNYNYELKTKFDKIKNFDEYKEYDKLQKLSIQNPNSVLLVSLQKEYERKKKLYQEYRNGTLDVELL